MAVALLILMVAMVPTVDSHHHHHHSHHRHHHSPHRHHYSPHRHHHLHHHQYHSHHHHFQQTPPYGLSVLQSDVNTLKSKVALLDQQVYFTATFYAGTLLVGRGTVVFDKVLMNTGGAYSPTTGVFTAPRRGLYVFLVQTFTYGRGHAKWDLHVNGRIVLRSVSNTENHTSNEYVYPVTLQAGDKVYVSSRKLVSIYGTDHSFFGGWLIKAF